MFNQQPNTQEPFQLNQVISNIVGQLKGAILKLENHYNLPSGYLKTSLALHLSQYPLYTLYNDAQSNLQINYQFLNTLCQRLAKSVHSKINSLPAELKSMVLLNQRNSKVTHHSKEIVEVTNKGEEKPIYFARVNSRVGELIQAKLHYISCQRQDTLFHFGLFRQGDRFPFAYAAFSILDRKYIRNNLPFKLPMNNLLVLTRSFNINSSPENSMSLLFGLCRQFFKDNFQTLKFYAILTAVNPNIFFKGTIFKASRFFLFATIPFEPLYYKGRYISRKYCQKFFNTQDKRELLKKFDFIDHQIDCQPTVWLGCGITPRVFEIFKNNQNIKQVTSQEYQAG